MLARLFSEESSQKIDVGGAVRLLDSDLDQNCEVMVRFKWNVMMNMPPIKHLNR